MFPPGGTAGGSPLDNAPPSPQSFGATPMGGQTPFSLDQISGGAPGAIPSGQLPPEILQSIMQSAQKIGSMFDAYAQVTPDLGAQWAQLKDQLQQILATLMQNGAPAMSPTASGQQFPAGGVDRGIANAGAI